jgi:hypothetical protein
MEIIVLLEMIVNLIFLGILGRLKWKSLSMWYMLIVCSKWTVQMSKTDPDICKSQGSH